MADYLHKIWDSLSNIVSTDILSYVLGYDVSIAYNESTWTDRITVSNGERETYSNFEYTMITTNHYFISRVIIPPFMLGDQCYVSIEELAKSFFYDVEYTPAGEIAGSENYDYDYYVVLSYVASEDEPYYMETLGLTIDENSNLTIFKNGELRNNRRTMHIMELAGLVSDKYDTGNRVIIGGAGLKYWNNGLSGRSSDVDFLIRPWSFKGYEDEGLEHIEIQLVNYNDGIEAFTRATLKAMFPPSYGTDEIWDKIDVDIRSTYTEGEMTSNGYELDPYYKTSQIDGQIFEMNDLKMLYADDAHHFSVIIYY